jgi:hypothetical protein
MIFVDQLFDIDAAQHKLLSIDTGKSRFRRHAVVTHTRSLQILLSYAMASLDRTTISSQLPVGTFTGSIEGNVGTGSCEEIVFCLKAVRMRFSRWRLADAGSKLAG